MSMNLAETAPGINYPMEVFKAQLARALAVSGPAQQPTGWQLCAAIFDALRRPDGPPGIADWVINHWNHQEAEVSVFIGPREGAKYEVFLTHIMSQSRNNNMLIASLAKELSMEADYLKRLAGIIDFPMTPPAIISPDHSCVYLWMPTCRHYISSDWGATVDMATLRQGSFWEYATVATWK